MAEVREQRPRWNSLTPTEQQELPPQTQQFRVTGPYGRIVYDADNKKSTLVEYKVGDMMTPAWEELDAHPDRFQEWPPSGTILAEPTSTDAPPPEEPPSTRSRR